MTWNAYSVARHCYQESILQTPSDPRIEGLAYKFRTTPNDCLVIHLGTPMISMFIHLLEGQENYLINTLWYWNHLAVLKPSQLGYWTGIYPLSGQYHLLFHLWMQLGIYVYIYMYNIYMYIYIYTHTGTSMTSYINSVVNPGHYQLISHLKII